jgi:hypothetical protein
VTDQLGIAMVVPPWHEVPPPAYGGIESMCADLINALVARGHDVTLVGVGAHHTRARFIASYEHRQRFRQCDVASKYATDLTPTLWQRDMSACIGPPAPMTRAFMHACRNPVPPGPPHAIGTFRRGPTGKTVTRNR